MVICVVVREKERWKYSCASLVVVVSRQATSPFSCSVHPPHNTSPSFIFIHYAAWSRATIFRKNLERGKKGLYFPRQRLSSFRFVQFSVVLGEGSVALNNNESLGKAV